MNNKYLTYQQVLISFKETYKDELKTNDLPLKRQLWNDYIDFLEKDGAIEDTKNNEEYWEHPSICNETNELFSL